MNLIKSKLFLFFILFSLLIGFCNPHMHIVENASAYSWFNIVNWDSNATGTHTGFVDNVYIKRISGLGAISSTTIPNSPSGANSFYFDGDGGADYHWINLTPTYNYIGAIRLYVRWYISASVGSEMNIAFYNESDEQVLELFFENPDNVGGTPVDVQYKNTGGGYTTLFSTTAGIYHYDNITIAHNGTNSMVYIFEGSNDDFQNGESAFAGANWINFTSIRLRTNNGNNKLYIDDIDLSLTGYEGYGTTIPSCSPDSTLGKIGLPSISRTGGKNYKYIHTTYTTERTMYIHRVDLEIDINMVESWGIGKNNIFCRINEHYLGSGDELIQLGEGENYRVSWTNINYYINNSIMSISFMNNKPTVNNQYWLLPITFKDVNNDGYQAWQSYKSDSYWNSHDEFIFEIPEPSFKYFGEEPLIRMCIEQDSSFEFNPNIENHIESFSSSNSANCSQINIDWFLNLTAMAYVNRLWIDTPSNIPYVARNITTQTGHIWFTPKETGTFYFNLSTNNKNHSTTQTTITSSCTSNWLYTVINPSGSTPFMIFYNYTGASNGAIRIYDSTNKLIDTIHIENGEHSLVYEINKHGVYYFRLCSISEIGGEIIYNQLYNYVHCVQGLIINDIEVLTEFDNAIINTPTLVSFQHAHLSKDVWIYAGSSKVECVSNRESGTITWSPNQQGEFTIKLLIELPSGKKVILASDTIGVVGADAYIDEPVLPELPTQIGYLIGTIIMIPFVLLPMLVGAGLGYTRTDIPQIAYMFTAGIGAVLNTALGFWDFWAIFFILAIGVIVLFAIFLIGKYRS